VAQPFNRAGIRGTLVGNCTSKTLLQIKMKPTKAGNVELGIEHVKNYFDNACIIAETIDKNQINLLASELVSLRLGLGRLFVLGVGGSAANATHAVNDFRKLCRIETYSPTDNVSELTARINDEGWQSCFAAWLEVSNLGAGDAILILSVGGGNREKGVSINLIEAMDYARKVGAKIFGIVGRDGGYTKEIGDVVVIVPTVNDCLVTPHSEAFQAVVWHCLVSHPALQLQDTKW